MIDDVIQLVISPNSRTPSRQGFGNLLCLGYHTHNVDLYREYEDEADMLADGFADTERPYLMARAAFSQDPRPPKVLVGRLATPSAQSLTVTVLTAVEGSVISFELVSPDGTVTTISRTVPAASSTTAEATAIELLTEAVAGVDSAAASAVITLTPTVAGAFIAVRNPKNCAIKDNSSDTGYATALTNILAATKDFYFVATDHNSETIGDAVAAWAQSNKRLYMPQSNDTIEATGTGTFGSGQKSASYTYSGGIFVHDVREYGACAMAAVGAVRDPGSFTWHLKALAGITPANLTETEQTNLDNAGWNYLVEVANGVVGIMGKNGGGASFGGGPGGAGRFLDLTHGTDWLSARIKERLFGTIASADKIDYEDHGVEILKAGLIAVLRQGEDNRLLAKKSSLVTYTPVANVDSADREIRYYQGLKFSARYSGAIHRARILGTLAE